jgi:hypothetical protein
VACARLHVVTGKGGTGKSTVAAALALALAAKGKRVLLCEVEGRQGIARMFDVDPLPYAERRIATGLGADGGGNGLCAPHRPESRRCWNTWRCTTSSVAPGGRLDRSSASSSSPPRSPPAYATCC